MNAYMNISVRMQTAQAQSQIAALEAEIKALRAQLGQTSGAGNAVNTIAKSGFLAFAKWGSQLQWAGRQLQNNFTYPLVASGGILTKWYLDNVAGMTRVAKVYGDATTGAQQFAADQGKLAEVMTLLSEKYGIARKDTLNIAADWAAAGASAGALADGVDSTLRTMVLGEMSATDATQALIAIQAQYGASSAGLIDIVNRLNATENATGTTFSGLVDAMSRAAGTARSAGVDVDHLAAMIAALSPAAGSAANAGNAIKTMLSRIMAPTGDAAEIMGLMGINIEDMSWKSLNGAERVELLSKKFHELKGATDDTVSSQAAFVSATIASRWNINRFDVLMRDVYNSMYSGGKANGYYGKTLGILSNDQQVAAIAARELKQVLDSDPVAVKRAGVAIQNDLMKVIAMLMPQIMWLIDSVKELTQRFTSMSPAVQKTVIGLLALLAALGPPMSMIGSLAVGIGRVGHAFQNVGTAFKSFLGFLGIMETEEKKKAASTARAAASTAGSASKAAGDIRATSASMAGSVRKAAASMVLSWRAAAREYEILVEQQKVGSLAWAGVQAKNMAVARTTAAAEASSALASTRTVIAARGKMAAVALPVASAYGRVAGAARTAATATASAWGTMATATRAGAARAIGATTQFATALPGAIEAGVKRAGTEYLKFTNLTLPIAMERGVDAVALTAYRGFTTMQEIMGRSLMENLAVLNSYVNAAAATGARGIGQMRAEMAGAAAISGGAMRAAGGTAAVAAGSGFLSKFSGIGGKIVTAFKGIGPKLGAAAAAFGPMIGRGLLSIGRFFTGPWGLAITAVLGLLVAFRKQIGQVFSNIGKVFADSTNPFGQAWAGVVNLFNKGVAAAQRAFRSLPEGIQGALRAVVNLVSKAAQAVHSWFSWMNPFVRHSPALVESVISGMAIVGDQFGIAADRIKTYALSAHKAMTAWGNATANFMANYNALLQQGDRNVIATNIPSAVGEYDNLIAALKPLKASLDAASAAVDAQQSVVDQLDAALTIAKNNAKALQDEMDGLQATAQTLSDKLDAAQTSLDNYASTPLQGMRAMSDAMFNNEMEQKKLQLAMMDWEKVNGSIDDVTSRMNSLQGAMEALRGEQNDLRASGAGSDILGPLNDQLTQMQDAYTAMDNSLQTGGISDMQKQLADLEKEAQRLDLQNSLNFDPLTRQIEQASKAYNELPFDTVIAGVKQQRAQVDELQKQYDTATAAVKAHEGALAAANAQVDAAQSAYDTQSASLQNLTNAYDAIKNEIDAITQSIQDVIDAANGMEEALKKAKGAGSGDSGLSPSGAGFLGAAGGSYADTGSGFTIGQDGTDLQTWLDNFMKNNNDLFKSFDIFGGLKDSFGKLQTWWSANVTPIFTNLAAGITQIFSGIDWSNVIDMWDKLMKLFGPEFQTIWNNASKAFADGWAKIKAAIDAFAPSLQGADGALHNIGVGLQWLWNNILVPLMKFIGGTVVAGFSAAFTMIGQVVGPVITMIANVIAGLIQIIRGVVDFVIGIFTGDWARAWNGVTEVVGGVVSTVWALISGMGQAIWGAIKGLVEGVVNFFQWLFDVLVGHSIIPDLVNAVMSWFGTMVSNVVNAVSGWVGSVIAWFQNLYTNTVASVAGMIAEITNWFNGIKDRVFGAIGDAASWLVNKGRDIVDGLWNGAKDVWNNVTNWLFNIGNSVLNAVGNVGDTLYNAGKNIIDGFFRGLKEKYQDVKDFIGGIGSWIADHKGPKSYDLGLLVSNGEWVMTGLGTGLGNGFKDVMDQVVQMGPSIASALNVPTDALAANAASAMNGVPSATAGNVVQQTNETNNYIFYGNLEFPNITSGDDAGAFIKNLNDLAGAH